MNVPISPLVLFSQGLYNMKSYGILPSKPALIDQSYREHNGLLKNMLLKILNNK